MALVFDRDFEPRHGEPVEIAPGVRRVTAPNIGPFTFQGTNAFLIGGAELTLLDPGPADDAHIEALLGAIGSARLTKILVSHSHRDHSAGARLLQARTGAPILAASSNRAGSPKTAAGIRLDAASDAHFAPDETLFDGTVLYAGGMRIEAVATPGHAADHLVFALLGTDLLFSGDHVMGWATTVVAPPDGCMAAYMTSLERLLARPERVYLPAHGGPIRDAHAYMRGLRGHRRMRERAILSRLAAGDRLIPDIVARVYRDIDPRLAAAAAHSTFAHLEDLVAHGLVATDGVATLGGRYWPTGAPDAGGSATDAGAAATGFGSGGDGAGTAEPGAFGSG